MPGEYTKERAVNTQKDFKILVSSRSVNTFLTNANIQ